MGKVLVICGPTATGKTQLALKIAQQFKGELISADSRQVYKGMDIGTGKDLPVNVKCQMSNVKWKNRNIPVYEVSNINLWLYDVVDPDQEFSVADYYELAWLAVKDIWKREKLPILVGGTGFYIKAVVDGIDTLGMPKNKQLREKLENKDVTYLQKRLKELNPDRLKKMNNSDRNNPRRLVRAIEISSKYQVLSIKKKQKIDSLFIGLTTDKDSLYKRIDERVEKRVKQGIAEEIRGLLEKGYSWDLPAMSGLGYRQWRDFFEGKDSRESAIEKWKKTEHQYAKRQLTWFKKDKRIIWYDILKKGFEKELLKRISVW